MLENGGFTPPRSNFFRWNIKCATQTRRQRPRFVFSSLCLYIYTNLIICLRDGFSHTNGVGVFCVLLCSWSVSASSSPHYYLLIYFSAYVTHSCLYRSAYCSACGIVFVGRAVYFLISPVICLVVNSGKTKTETPRKNLPPLPNSS